jgi:TonB-linked SusC/RagA family outer membrane protein
MKMINIYINKTFITFAGFLLLTLSVQGQDSLPNVQPDSIANHSTTDSLLTTGSLYSITGAELMRNYSGSLTNALNGLIPGLVVTEITGKPGSRTASLSIRGYGNYYSRSITVYVDGFETGMNYLESISPSEIEQISVLKDAAALATFGMKGANGVLLVTTKRGDVGKTKVDFNFRTGMQLPAEIYKPLRSYDYANLYNEAKSNDKGMVWTPQYSADQLQAYKNGTGNDVDWFDEALSNNGKYTDGNLSFKGGNEGARYFTTFGYLNNKGIYDVPTNDETSNALQNRYNVRLNVDFNMFKVIEGKVDVGGIIDDRQSPNISDNTLWNSMINYPSNIYPVGSSSTQWTGTSVYPNNPVASINALGYTSTHDRTMQGRFSLKEKLDDITKGLYLEQTVYFNTWTRGTYNRTRNYARYINSVVQTTDQNTNFVIMDDNGTNQWNTKHFTGTLGYKRSFNEHILTANFNYLIQSINLDESTNGSLGLQTKFNSENLGGVLNYNYSQKYVAEFGFAYSGTDNFAKGNRWGFYPSFSMAWNLSEEQFLKNNETINALKLRASVGKTGDDKFYAQRYPFMEYYTQTSQFITSPTVTTNRTGYILLFTPNEDIFAEQSIKYNIGINTTLLKKLTVSLDGFVDKRSGIVTVDNTLSAIYGAIPQFLNIGKVTTKGAEANLLYKNEIGKVGYFVSGNLLYTNNTLDYKGEIAPASSNAAETGKAMGTRFGLEANGFYDITDFNPDGSLIASRPIPTFGAVQPGDIAYKDLNSDGYVDEKDKTDIGTPNFPTTTYSFSAGVNSHGFDLQLMFQGVAGRSVNLLDYPQAVAFKKNGNVYPIAQDRWAYYPSEGIDTRSIAKYPRLSTLNNANNYQNSTFWQKNGNYLKLRSIEIGYTLPETLLKKAGLSNLRISLNAMNLLSFSWLESNYSIDPQNNRYPSMKSFLIGININL